jgi:hypothetical protein
MNLSTHAALQTLTCGVDHDVVLIEDDGSLFLESEAVGFCKLKCDANLSDSDRLCVSRKVSQTKGVPLETKVVPLEPVHDPADVEYLRHVPGGRGMPKEREGRRLAESVATSPELGLGRERCSHVQR